MGAAVGEWSRLGRVEIWDLISDQFPGGQGWYYMIRRSLIGRIWGDKANEGWDQEEEKHEVGLQHFLPRCYSFWSLILAILFYPPPWLNIPSQWVLSLFTMQDFLTEASLELSVPLISERFQCHSFLFSVTQKHTLPCKCFCETSILWSREISLRKWPCCEQGVANRCWFSLIYILPIHFGFIPLCPLFHFW